MTRNSSPFTHGQLPRDREGGADAIWEDDGQAHNAVGLDCRECGDSVDIQLATLLWRARRDRLPRERMESPARAEGGLVDAAGLLERNRIDLEDLPC